MVRIGCHEAVLVPGVVLVQHEYGKVSMAAVQQRRERDQQQEKTPPAHGTWLIISIINTLFCFCTHKNIRRLCMKADSDTHYTI